VLASYGWHRFMFVVSVLVAISGHQLFASVKATTTGGNICNSATHKAALLTGVPEGILLAISLTETGRRRGERFTAWPWTVNMEGKGYWFGTREKAFAFAQKNFKAGARSFDVGCFQINYKWHGHAFSSIGAMFDPDKNAIYAAKYLLELYREKGNWPDAVGAYHSRTQKFAKQYFARFTKIHADLTGKKAFSAPVLATSILSLNLVRPNRYPLLQHPVGANSTSGSIVALVSDGKPTALMSVPKERLF